MSNKMTKKTTKMSNKVTFYTTVVKTYEFTYEDFCAMAEVKDLSDEKKADAWQSMLKKSKRGEIEVQAWQDEEDAEWDDVEHGILDAVEEAVEEVTAP